MKLRLGFFIRCPAFFLVGGKCIFYCVLFHLNYSYSSSRLVALLLHSSVFCILLYLTLKFSAVTPSAKQAKRSGGSIVNHTMKTAFDLSSSVSSPTIVIFFWKANRPFYLSPAFQCEGKFDLQRYDVRHYQSPRMLPHGPQQSQSVSSGTQPSQLHLRIHRYATQRKPHQIPTYRRLQRVRHALFRDGWTGRLSLVFQAYAQAIFLRGHVYYASDLLLHGLLVSGHFHFQRPGRTHAFNRGIIWANGRMSIRWQIRNTDEQILEMVGPGCICFAR